MSEGFVSLKSSSSKVPIKIMRHWGYSLFLEGVLPLGVSTSTGESVIFFIYYQYCTLGTLHLNSK